MVWPSVDAEFADFHGWCDSTIIPDLASPYRLESRTLLPNVALRCAIEEYFSGFAKQNANQIEFHEIELVGEIAVAKSKAVYEGLYVSYANTDFTTKRILVIRLTLAQVER